MSGEQLKMLPEFSSAHDSGDQNTQQEADLESQEVDQRLAPDYTRMIYGFDLTRSDNFYGQGREEGPLFNSVIEQYELGDVRELKFPHVVSTTSRKTIVVSDNGSYFLKEKPVYCCEPDSLRLAANFQNFLAERAHCVPPIISTRTGEPYAIVGSKIFLLTEFRDERIFRGDFADVEVAGETLGILHRISLDYPDTAQYPKKISSLESEIFVNMAEHLTNTEDDPWKQQAIAALIDILNKSAIDTSSNSNFLHMIIHGDFAPFNMVFRDGGIVGVNDFDNCGHHPRIRELAEGMMTFCDGISYAGNTSSYRRPISTRFNVEKAGVFFQAYTRHAPSLSKKERKLLTNEMKILWVELMGLGLVRGDFNYYDIMQAVTFPDFVDKNIPKVVQ